MYCDFSIAVRSVVPVREYLDALEREWSARHRESQFALETLYLGGGTPSKLGGSGVHRLLDLVRSRAEVPAAAEVTLEANPEDVARDTVNEWRAAGVNRVSLGVQSFNDETLRWMHRTHDAAQAVSAVDVLREGGIDNISIDLIFAIPTHGGVRSWKEDLETTLRLDLPHVSAYGLTVEPHTPLGRWVARSDADEAAEETFEDEFLAAHRTLEEAGFDHYEVSNFGKPGSHSRHNWAYWKRQPYGGIGPSAHEFDGASRRWNARNYVEWIALSAGKGDPVAGFETLTPSQVLSEEMYLSLRTSSGLAISPSEMDFVTPFVEAGWATLSEGDTLRLVGAGWLRLDSIATALTTLRSH